MVRKCVGTLLKLRLRVGVRSALAKMESLISSGGWLDGKKSNDVSSYFPRPRNISFRISALSKGIFLRRGKEMFLRSVFHLPWWIGPILRQHLSLCYSRCLFQFLQVARLNRNSGLSQIALQKRQCRWKQRPKIHQVHHIIMSYLPKNPKSFGNYLDEDFVRLVKTRAATCHPKSLGKTVLWKYSLSMCIRWGVLKL